MTRAHDPRGYGFTWTYDHRGRCIACRGDDGLWGATLEYEVGRTLVTEADGGQWAYRYNNDSVITHVVDPLGGIKQYRTDERGLISHQIDPAGLVTRWLYDRHGHHHGRIDPWGSLLPPENDDPSPATGRELFIPAEPRTMQLGRLESFEHPVAPQPDLELGAIPVSLRPQLAAVLHAAQRRPGVPTQRFDVAGQPLARRDAWGPEEQTTYSPLGEPVASIDADGRTIRREFGSWGLKLREADPSGAVTRYVYDHRERIIAITDPRGHRVRYDRDTCGRVQQIWNGDQLEER